MSGITITPLKNFCSDKDLIFVRDIFENLFPKIFKKFSTVIQENGVCRNRKSEEKMAGGEKNSEK